MSNMPTTPAYDKLRWVDHLSLNDMAEFFESQAELCRQQAERQLQGIEERQAAAIDHLFRTPRIVIRFLKQGCTLEEAQERAAKESGAPVFNIQRAWKRFCQDKNLYELRRRNRLILELAAMGMTNADIGRKVNLHPGSVSRIISAARKTYHQGRAVSDKVKLIVAGGCTPTNDNPLF